MPGAFGLGKPGSAPPWFAVVKPGRREPARRPNARWAFPSDACYAPCSHTIRRDERSARPRAESVERAPRGHAASQHVRVDLRRLEARVTEKALQGPDVGTILEQVRGEAMTQRVARSVLVDARLPEGARDAPTDVRRRPVMPPRHAAPWVHAQARSGKHVLPGPPPACRSIFYLECIRQPYLAVATAQILLMKQFYPRQVAFQRAVERARQHGNTVFVALAGTNDDLLPSEVEILYAQRERFGETQARAIEQRGEQIRLAAQMAEKRRNFLPSQDDRYVCAALWPNEDSDFVYRNAEHFAIQK